MIEVPEVVANKARSLGAERWLADLEGTVAGLEADWGITVGHPHDGGTEAWVADAIDAAGRPAVLKLCMPRPTDDDPWHHARREGAVLDRIGGRGCVELRRCDLDRGALLLERLGPSMADLGLAHGLRTDILCDLAARLWTSPSGLDVATGAEKARDLASFIEATWEELDRPCGARAVELAVAAARRREAAHDPDRAVLAHGDVHQWNALQAEPGTANGTAASWKLIDPDGLAAEPEYDLGVLLREDPDELMADIERDDPRRLARYMADRTGTGADAIWDWGLVERVSTGLLATRIGLQPVGADMLAVADRLV